MKKSLWILVLLALVSPASLIAQAATWEPTRVNKVIELWDANQPAYYTQISEYGYDECQALAGTEADYISINMEHSYVDIRALRDCMTGLVDAGPTRSGHRTPAVIAVTPAWGWTETEMRANSWKVQQIQGAGVHGIFLTHAVDPAAVRIMMEHLRFPFAPTVPGLAEGRQGNGTAGFPANIWGLSNNEWIRKSDPYGLSPEGEFLVALKIENTHAALNVDQLVAVPGVAFIEHGPGDMMYWHGGPEGDYPGREGDLTAIRDRIFQAAYDAGVHTLHSCNDLSWIEQGVRVCTNAATAEAGRLHFNRQMPW